MKHFQITVQEIPNNYIVRKSYRETYEICAENATEAKQSGLDKFGDFSKVTSCSQFDPDFPPVIEYIDQSEDD